jgi:hypothetical protein
MEVGLNFASDPGEIDATPPEGFLYQSGYLTLRENDNNQFFLEYPNREVREAISQLFLENLNSDWRSLDQCGRDLNKHLTIGDIHGMVRVFKKLLAGICYYDHSDALDGSLNNTDKKNLLNVTGADIIGDQLHRQPSGPVQPTGQPSGPEEPSGPLQPPVPVEPSGPEGPAKQNKQLETPKSESFYRSILQACLWMAGARVTPEKLENLGRLDLEVVFGNQTYVIEIKMTKNARGAAQAARAGMKQIHARGYGRASDRPVLVSLAIGREERNVVGCLFERDGQVTKVKV